MEDNKEIIKFGVCGVLFVMSFFIPQNIIYYGILILLYILLSYNIWLDVLGNLKEFKFMDEKFLMIIATVGAIAIKEYPEAIAVMLFYQIGEYLGDRASENTKAAVTKLMDLRSDTAHVKIDGEIKTIEASLVKQNDMIVVNPGERIPLDGIVSTGTSSLDTSSMTGESVLRSVKVGDTVMSGCVNQEGVLEIKVTSDYQNSTVSKMIALMEQASESKSKQEKFITKFAKYYTPVVVGIACLLTIIPLCLGKPFSDWFYKSLVFLVISCPCALVVSIPLGFFSGIGIASKKGILIKKSVALENLDQINTVIFDKTGTLTKGNFEVQKVIPLYYTKEEVLKYAAIAESHSNHPIAKAIKNAYATPISEEEISDLKEIAGKGIQTTYQEKEILVGNETLFDEWNIDYPKIEWVGTTILVALNHEYIGTIVIADEIKPNTTTLVERLKQNGIIKVIMLSGDNEKTVKKVGEHIHIDSCYANLLPTDKVEIVKEIKKTSKIAFVGDGMNDAPVLMCADIGISMGGIGSDAAIEASDIVIMNDDPNLLISAIQIAKKTKKIVKMNMIFAITVKLAIMILGIFGIASMWLAVFADVGVTLLTILNALRIFKIKTT